MSTTALCQCGCGEPTRLAPYSHKRVGWVKGEPIRFVNGHRHRNNSPQHREEDRGFSTPCWVWQWSLDGKGYGQLYHEGRMHRAHRVFYERALGPIPQGLELDHLCSTPRCVNPDHLEPVTHLENLRRGALARLTPQSVREIRTQWERGEPLHALAAAYGVSQSHVRAIVARRRWKDVA